VSSIRYRGSMSPASPSTVRKDLSARPVSTSRTAPAGSSPPGVLGSSPQTCSAAASVAPPGSGASRRASTRSGFDSRSQLHSTTARSVWCRGSAVRLPPVSTANLSSSRPVSWAGDMVRSRAAASSMASGIPSRARQMPATSAALAPVTAKPGRTARARSASSRTEAAAMIAASSPSPESGGTGSGGTGHTVSPVIPSASRLAARTLIPWHPDSTASASPATASIRCSQLSSTSSPDRSRRPLTRRRDGSASEDTPGSAAWPGSPLLDPPSSRSRMPVAVSTA